MYNINTIKKLALVGTSVIHNVKIYLLFLLDHITVCPNNFCRIPEICGFFQNGFDKNYNAQNDNVQNGKSSKGDTL